jgi:hypothetical protein
VGGGGGGNNPGANLMLIKMAANCTPITATDDPAWCYSVGGINVKGIISKEYKRQLRVIKESSSIFVCSGK